MTNTRPTWPNRMLKLAEHWSQYSTCIRRQVGAVIYDPNTYAVISIGYNDTAIAMPDCGDGGCQTCKEPEDVKIKYALDCLCIHAELNAILLSARRGTAVLEMHMAVTYKPCNSCRKHMAQAGIAKVLLPDGQEMP